MDNLAVAIAQLTEMLGSLKPKTEVRTFAELCELYLDRHNHSGCRSVRLLKAELGTLVVDKSFSDAWERWMLRFADTPTRQGERPSPATVNRYRSWTRAVLKFGIARGRIDIDPIRDYGVDTSRETERDRVWSPEERDALYAAMLRLNSPLDRLVRFCSKNPIRIKSDALRLTRENLEWVLSRGERRPWIKFLPKKTERKCKRPTFLVEIDDCMIEYWASLPAECPLLFPCTKIYPHQEDAQWGERPGFWRPMGNPKRHWDTLCEKAKITDFRIHDLKHVAMTHMLDSGYSELDLRNLGIQYSEKMIRRYYHYDAVKVFERFELRKKAA